MNTASYKLIENHLGVAFVKQLREISAPVPQLLSIQPQTIQPLQPTPSWFASLSAVTLAVKISNTGRCLNNQPFCVFRICLPVSALGPPQSLLGSASVTARFRLSHCSVQARLPLRTLASIRQYSTEQATSHLTERPSGGVMM